MVIASPLFFVLGIIFLVLTIAVSVIFFMSQNKYPPATTKDISDLKDFFDAKFEDMIKQLEKHNHKVSKHNDKSK